MPLWLYPTLFVLLLWGAFSRRGSPVGKLALIALALFLLFFSVIILVGAMTAQ